MGRYDGCRLELHIPEGYERSDALIGYLQGHLPGLALEVFQPDKAEPFLRAPEGGDCRAVFTLGFCMGGRLSWLAAAQDLDLAGVIEADRRATFRAGEFEGRWWGRGFSRHTIRRGC